MKKIICIFIGLLYLVPCWAESTIWKLDSDKVNFFLAGSLHVLKPSDYPLPKEFELAYLQTDQLVLETILDNESQARLQQEMLDRGLYRDGTTISQILNPEVYRELEQFCRSRGLDMGQLQSFKPWFLVLTLTVAELQRIGTEQQSGVDSYFNNRAKRDGKTVAGLEGMDQQIQAMLSLGGHEPNQVFSKLVRELEQAETQMAQLTAAWKSGDEQALIDLLLNNVETEYPRMYKTLYLNRNLAWIEPIENLIRSGRDTLVIVGSAHLFGNDNVRALLEAKGYVFTKYNLDASLKPESQESASGWRNAETESSL